MAIRGSKVRFQLFRYQILPIEKEKQFDIHSPISGVKDITELKQRKNEFFYEALSKIKKFEHPYGNVNHKLMYDSADKIIIKMASQKKVELHDENFSKEDHEDWPPIIIFIDNRPAMQNILIENNHSVFSTPEVVTNILQNNINEKLEKYFLSMYIKPRFEVHEFWSLVSKYEEKIKSINFELISPNLANISRDLKVDLQQLNKETNNHTTNLELNSQPNSHLKIDPNSPMINSLVKYSSDGGGDISMRIKGLRKKVHTKNTIKEIEIDEIEISNANDNQLNKILSELE